jgi:thiamine biosynthesis protein ThiI
MAAARVGERVLDANPSLKVNLTKPDHEVFIEIRHGLSYIYTDVIEGPGGMPVGSAGRVAAIVQDRDDALAAWLMMKRGCMPLLMGNRELMERLLFPWLPSLKFHDDLPVEKLIAYAGYILISRERDISKMAKPDGYTIFYPMAGLTDEDVDVLTGKMLARSQIFF